MSPGRRRGTINAKSGQLIQISGTGEVILPKPLNNQEVEVFGEGVINAEKEGGRIYGDFISAQGKIHLAGLQHVRLKTHVVGGSIAWLIVAGEARREQQYEEKIYSEAEAKTGATPSATRPAIVTLVAVGTISEKLLATFSTSPGVVAVGSVRIGGVATVIPEGTVTLFLNPGQKWELFEGQHLSAVQASTVLL